MKSIILVFLIFCSSSIYSQQIKASEIITFIYSDDGNEAFENLAESLHLQDIGLFTLNNGIQTTRFQTTDSKTPHSTIYFFEENGIRTIIYETTTWQGYNWMKLDLSDMNIKKHFYVENETGRRTYFTHSSQKAHLEGGFKISVNEPSSPSNNNHISKYIFSRPKDKESQLAESNRIKKSVARKPQTSPEKTSYSNLIAAVFKSQIMQEPLPSSDYNGRITYSELYKLCKSSGNSISSLANKYSFTYDKGKDSYFSTSKYGDIAGLSFSVESENRQTSSYVTNNREHFSLIVDDLEKIGYHLVNSLYKKSDEHTKWAYQHSNDTFYLVYLTEFSNKNPPLYVVEVVNVGKAYEIFD